MSRIIDWENLEPIWENKPEITAAWVFGSAQTGEVRSKGDVDIGLLMAAVPSFDEQLDLFGRLQQALNMDEVDLVILNEANPILRFEAVSGRRLYCRDPQAVAGFVSLTAREYENEVAQWELAVRLYRRADALET